MTTAKMVIDVMNSWVGKSRAKGTHKDIIDLYKAAVAADYGKDDISQVKASKEGISKWILLFSQSLEYL